MRGLFLTAGIGFEASRGESKVAYMGGPGSGPRRRSRWPSTRGWRDWYQLERWRKISRRQLEAEVCCRLCLKTRGVITIATVCDHVVDHHGDPHKFWNSE